MTPAITTLSKSSFKNSRQKVKDDIGEDVLRKAMPVIIAKTKIKTSLKVNSFFIRLLLEMLKITGFDYGFLLERIAMTTILASTKCQI